MERLAHLLRQSRSPLNTEHQPRAPAVAKPAPSPSGPFATGLVPTWVWQSLFVTGHGLASSVENVALGPLLAILAFVCSIGNVPLAVALWVGGISFGGVISFIFADLITLPLLLIYRRYYGTRLTLRLLAAFWVVMSAAALATQYLFTAAGLVPTTRPPVVARAGVHWNYTTVLNILAVITLGGLYWLYRHRQRFGGGVGYAKDPVCGMQVETAIAPAKATRSGQTYYFCSDHCQHRFTPDPIPTSVPTVDTAMVDPVCGMTLDTSTAHAVALGRHTVYFCSAGCRNSFTDTPNAGSTISSTRPHR